MAKQITDDEDRLKRQARRRLIGAVALTTAVVVILPMVLDREPRPVGQNIELRIPDKDKSGEFVPKMGLPSVSVPASSPIAAASAPMVISAPAPVPALPQAVAASALAPAAVAVVAAAAAVAPLAETKPTPPPAKTAAPAPKPEPARQAAKPEPAKPAAKPEPAKPKPDTKAEHAKADTKKEHAKRETGGAKTEQGQPAPTSGFIVQIGAFNNADTAHSWQKNLKAQGFKAYTEKLGEKTRVRIGPFPTREAANAARKKLEKTQRLHANIVDLSS